MKYQTAVITAMALVAVMDAAAAGLVLGAAKSQGVGQEIQL